MTLGRKGQLIPFPGTHPVDPPAVGKEIEPAEEVLEGELLSDEESAAVTERLRGHQRIALAAQRTIALVVVVGENERTSTAVGRASLSAAVAVVQGVGSWRRRAWDAGTMGVYRRAVKHAELTGDQEKLAEWLDRQNQARERRHRRMMDLPKLALSVSQGMVAALVGLVVFLLFVAGVVALSGAGSFAGVIRDALTVTRWVLTAVAVVWVPVLAASPLFVLVAAWREGKRVANPPRWLIREPSAGDVMDGLPDEGTIVKALHNLNIRGFNQALKDGWMIRFRMPPAIDGKGWRCQLDLPPACPVEEIVKRKPMLAHNLLRYPIEVWPTEPQATVLDLWIANPGVLSGPVDPWPLLADLDNITTDYFAGVPAGITIKGDMVTGRLFEANYVIGGMMGSGKSTLVITLLLGAMLDPLVDIDVVVMAENADYEPMKPRLRTLITGAGDETVLTCLSMLTALYEDLSVRGQALREHDARAVTRKLALADERLRPRIMVVDECQALFMGSQGRTALEVASKLQSAARKYAVTLMWLTPEPSKDSLPRKLITITSNKGCFAIGDQYGNDAVLGTGSYKTGISAVGLTPKTEEGDGDVGTCMARGFMAKPGLLRSYYVPQADAHRVTRRAMALREQHGITTTQTNPEQDGERDLLEDLDQALGDVSLRAADLPALLRELAPNYEPYRTLTGKQLVAQLAKLGVKVPSTDNRWPVDPVAIRRRLAERATEDLDDEDDHEWAPN